MLANYGIFWFIFCDITSEMKESNWSQDQDIDFSVINSDYFFKSFGIREMEMSK